MGALELLDEFDPFICELIEQRELRPKSLIPYLSKAIYEQIIEIMGKKIIKTITTQINNDGTKYYSIVMDSAPDLSHTDQRAIVLQYCFRRKMYERISFDTAIQNSVENQPQNITLPLNSTVSSILTNQPRLPKLTLESFSGKDISSFPSFGARLKSAVHENSSLNDVDKFSYLKSVVTSDAELAIRGLTLTSENYAKAIKILENRFGRKELIVDFHMNRLLNLTPVRKSFDVIALRNLYDQGEVLLQCVKAEIIGRSSSDKIFCLFDNGSEKSFIKKKCVSEVGVENIGFGKAKYFSFGCKTPKKQTCSKVEVRLRNVLSGEETVIEALEIEEISKATLSLPNPDAWAEMESKGFRLTFSCNESSENFETRLGWSLQGKCDERSDCTLVHLVHSEEESISTELRRFWEIESLGILDKGSVTLGNGDEEILSEFDKSVNFVDGRYRVNLPWKPGLNVITSCSASIRILIDDYVREGIVERTSCDSLLDSQGFYLPHHAVIRSDKTTSRIRIVFDGSAHEDGQSSLNQSLYTGPNLHPNILELLLCFRKSPVAFTADVKSAFLQIELDIRDRDFTRFFWTDNLNNEPYVLNFTRVLFGLRPSPYHLAATLKHHFKKYREQYPHTFELLNSSIYVDDLICGQNDVPDALRTTLKCLQIFSDAGMLLRKWRSNSKQLNLLWQQGVKTESSETGAIDLRPPTKVLGLAWDPENDLIYFDPKDLLKFMSRRGESERFILSVVGRIFDPIGILGPFVIKLKCLLQELWTLGVEWDSELPPKLRHKWQQWSSEAEGLTEIKIPRFYLVGTLSKKDNPADLLSRGTSAVKLAQNELWWHGPPWLKLTPNHWPNRHRDILDSELCSEELEHRSSVHVAVTQQREALVDINRFSSLKKLLKTTACVFRFVNNARNICKSMDFYITADEIQNAEYFWLKCVQSEFYSAEILAIKQNEQLRSSSEIKSLVPYLDENNLLRLTGRLLEADLCFGEKHPVILPRRCKFTELLVIRGT
ncbi:integrase catalytic domain-containing protein [Trichonephila clavipes]|nr:integrase catalytic domain-containing protein [Trichonephila clavipes]